MTIQSNKIFYCILLPHYRCCQQDHHVAPLSISVVKVAVWLVGFATIITRKRSMNNIFLSLSLPLYYFYWCLLLSFSHAQSVELVAMMFGTTRVVVEEGGCKRITRSAKSVIQAWTTRSINIILCHHHLLHTLLRLHPITNY